jgi:hypothetical protein
MKRLYLFFFLVLTLFSCAKKGYVPHYIVTDSKEPQQESSVPSLPKTEDSIKDLDH